MVGPIGVFSACVSILAPRDRAVGFLVWILAAGWATSAVSAAAPPKPRGLAEQIEEVPAGPLKLELTASGTRGKAEEPLLLTLQLRNAGTENATYDPQQYEPFRVLRVSTLGGGQDWFIGRTQQTSGDIRRLATGETVVLWENRDISPLFLLEHGHYRLQVVVRNARGQVTQASNVVDYEIRGGQLPPAKQFLKQLRGDVPQGWTLSLHDRSINAAHSPSNLKRDVTFVNIVFSDQPPKQTSNPQQPVLRMLVTYLGEHPGGHCTLYAHPRAKTLWPEYETVVRKVLEP